MVRASGICLEDPGFNPQSGHLFCLTLCGESRNNFEASAKPFTQDATCTVLVESIGDILVFMCTCYCSNSFFESLLRRCIGQQPHQYIGFNLGLFRFAMSFSQELNETIPML